MIRVEKTALPVLALTHPGMKGKNNEDNYGVSAFMTGDQPAVPVLLAVLCDGIGGHRAGEVASRMAVDTISNYVAESDGRNPPRILQEAIHQASQLIQAQAQSNSEQQGMGTTCACAWIMGDRLFTATVGDSRIYLMRGNRIIQLSTDHTWIQEALERGLLQPEQAVSHPNAHVIRRYLGSPGLPEVDFRIRLNEKESDSAAVSNQGMQLLPGDRLLICSDGLTDLVQNEEIMGAFLEMPQEEAGQRLIDLANERGGHDNITLIGIHIPPILEETQRIVTAAPRARRSMARSLAWGCLGVVVLGVLAGGFLGGYFLRYLPATPTPRVTLTLTIPVQATLPARPSGTLPTVTITLPPIHSPTPMRTQTLPGATATSTPELLPSVTPWPKNTATQPLPVVTVTTAP